MTAILACRRSEVSVTVQNASGHDLRRVVLTGSGFVDTMAQVPAGQSVTLRVRPRGESGLAVSFIADGREFAGPAQGYFEGDGYAVKATVDSTFAVDVISTLQ
jgi:CTP:molybdopterin cytidylyltransferase MocA